MQLTNLISPSANNLMEKEIIASVNEMLIGLKYFLTFDLLTSKNH